MHIYTCGVCGSQPSTSCGVLLVGILFFFFIFFKTGYLTGCKFAKLASQQDPKIPPCLFPVLVLQTHDTMPGGGVFYVGSEDQISMISMIDWQGLY